MIHQRLRGFLGTTIAVSIPWIALGLLAGVVFQFDLIPGVHAEIRRYIPGGMVTAGALVGCVVGLVNGLSFSGLLLATEHGKNIDQVSGWRFTAWGAVATAATLGLLIQVPLAAGIGAAVGAVAGLSTFATVRRARIGAAHSPSLNA